MLGRLGQNAAAAYCELEAEGLHERASPPSKDELMQAPPRAEKRKR